MKIVTPGRWFAARPSGTESIYRIYAESCRGVAHSDALVNEAQTLVDAFRIPGTRVLQFAFDGHSDNPYLPDNYIHNTVVNTGTHDNPTTRGWYEDLPDAVRRNLWSDLKRAPGTGEQVTPARLGLAWSSTAALAMAPLQDVLNLGNETRMNQAGRADGNWRWRCTDEMRSEPAFQCLRDLTHAWSRTNASMEAPSCPEPIDDLLTHDRPERQSREVIR